MEELCPTKGVFLCLGGFLGKILTSDQLKRRGFSIANCCPLCQKSEETVDHLLLHCTMTRVLWDLLFSLFGVSWVLLASVRDSLLGWKGPLLAKDRRKVWKAGRLCIFWLVWKARNSIVFGDEILSIQRLKSSFVHLFWSETKVYFVDGPASLVHFF